MITYCAWKPGCIPEICRALGRATRNNPQLASKRILFIRLHTTCTRSHQSWWDLLLWLTSHLDVRCAMCFWRPMWFAPKRFNRPKHKFFAQSVAIYCAFLGPIWPDWWHWLLANWLIRTLHVQSHLTFMHAVCSLVSLKIKYFIIINTKVVSLFLSYATFLSQYKSSLVAFYHNNEAQKEPNNFCWAKCSLFLAH